MVRLQHIIECVETGEWPVSRAFSLYNVPSGSGGIDVDRDSSTPCSLPDGSDVITITADHSGSGRPSAISFNPALFNANSSLSITPTVTPNLKRKRHIAIDVETERGELLF